MSAILPCGIIGYLKLRYTDVRHNAIIKKGEQIYVHIEGTKYRLDLPDYFTHQILDIILDKSSRLSFYDSSLTIYKEFEFIYINGQKVRNANIFNCENIFEESSAIILPCEDEQHRIAYSVKMTEMNNIVEEQLKVYLATRTKEWEMSDSPAPVEKGDCNICLDTQYLHNCITLPCSHSFHMHCISTWFTTKKSCPTCRSTKIGGDPFYSRGYNLTYALLNMELKKYF